MRPLPQPVLLLLALAAVEPSLLAEAAAKGKGSKQKGKEQPDVSAAVPSSTHLPPPPRRPPPPPPPTPLPPARPPSPPPPPAKEHQQVRKGDVPAYELPVNVQLMSAAHSGNAEVAQRLIQERADVNVQGGHGWSPLMQAMIGAYGSPGFNAVSIANVLIAARADLNLKDGGGRTALFFATKSDSAEVIDIFWDAKELQAPHSGSPSALGRATRDGHVAAIDALLALGHHAERWDSFGDVPLDQVRRLMRRGKNNLDHLAPHVRHLLQDPEVMEKPKREAAEEL